MYDEWKPIYTALVCDIMDGMGYRDQSMDYEIRPAQAEAWFAGPAITLDAYPSDAPSDDPYGKIFAAYEQMSPGQVVVLAANGELKSGLWGELLATAAVVQGVHSIVTDGLVRDVRLINDMGFNCFSKGYSPLDSAGRILAEAVNVPVQCGGVAVNPGDFILADYEGVAVIPAAIRQEVFDKSNEKLEGENTVRDELLAGQSPRVVFDKYGIL